jgi:hypothetical protein
VAKRKTEEYLEEEYRNVEEEKVVGAFSWLFIE